MPIKAITFSLLMVFASVASAQVSLPQNCQARPFLLRGDLTSSQPGSRLWKLDQIATAQRQNPSDICTAAIHKQAVSDAQSYWDSIKARCAAGSSPHLNCSHVDENEAYLKVVQQGLTIAAPTCPKSAPQKLTEQVGQIIAQIPPRTDDRNCPTEIIKQRKADASTWGSFGLHDATRDTCIRIPQLVKMNFHSAADFEKFLSGNPDYSSVNNAFITGPYCAKYMQGLGEDDKVAVVSDYYYYSGKLEGGELALIENIAAVDSLLNDKQNFAASGACSTSRALKPKQWCENLKKCGGNSSGYTSVTTQVKEGLEQLKALDAAEKSENSKISYMNRPQVNQVQQKYAAAREVVRQSHPLLTGKFFSDPSTALQNVDGAVRSQLQFNRDEFKKKLDQTRGYQDCLDKNSCAPSKVADFLKTIPMKLPHMNPADGRKDINNYLAQGSLEASQDCQNLREINNDIDSRAAGLATDLGMTLLGGFGAAVRAGRVVSVLSKAEKAIALTMGAQAALSTSIDAYKACMAPAETAFSLQSGAPSCGQVLKSTQWEKDSACGQKLLGALVATGSATFMAKGILPSKPGVEVLPVARERLPPAVKEPLPIIDVEPVRPPTVGEAARPSTVAEVVRPAPKLLPASSATTLEQRAHVKQLFNDIEGQTAMTEEGQYAVNQREMTLYGGQNGKIAQDMSQRKFAVGEGRIYENTSLRELPAGTYTYVVLDDGGIVYGRVDSNLEIGVKHFQLADGRRVVLAGEVRVSPHGSPLFNVESGTYTKNIKIEQGFKTDDLAKRMSDVFSKDSGKPARATRDVLIPQDPAVRRNYLKYCLDAGFYALNSGLCIDAGARRSH